MSPFKSVRQLERTVVKSEICVKLRLDYPCGQTISFIISGVMPFKVSYISVARASQFLRCIYPKISFMHSISLIIYWTTIRYQYACFLQRNIRHVRWIAQVKWSHATRSVREIFSVRLGVLFENVHVCTRP